MPRDRAGTCEPQLIGKHERRFTGFDDKIIGLYARGMTVREIRAFLANLRARRCEDILIAVTDRLTGMAAALDAGYPADDRPDLHRAPHSPQLGLRALAGPQAGRRGAGHDLSGAHGRRGGCRAGCVRTNRLAARYPMIAKQWRRAWAEVIPFFAFPPEIRRMIYTTNALENVNRQMRKAIKTRGHFPNDDAAITLVWLALRNVTKAWMKPSIHWRAAMTQFAIPFEDRFAGTRT